MNKITVHFLNKPQNDPTENPSWQAERTPSKTVNTKLTGSEAAEAVFNLTALPNSELTEEQKTLKTSLFEDTVPPTIQTGDIIEIEKDNGEKTFLMCDGPTWEQRIEPPKNQILLEGNTCRVEPYLFKSSHQIGIHITAQQNLQGKETKYLLTNPCVEIPNTATEKNTLFLENTPSNQKIIKALEASGIANQTGKTLTTKNYPSLLEMKLIEPFLLKKVEELQSNRIREAAFNRRNQPPLGMV